MSRAFVSVGLLAVFAACRTAELPPPPSPIRMTNMALSISSLTLENGLRVVLVRDPLARELQVTMRYSVGGVDDPLGQEGIAHLVEHLMFQQIVGAESIFSKLEATTRWFNATTTYDATTYTSRAPAERLDARLAVETIRTRS